MTEPRQGSSPRLPRACDEDPFELGGRLSCFDNFYTKSEARLAPGGELRLKRRPFLGSGPWTDGANRFPHRPQKPDRTFRNDDMTRAIPKAEPDESVGGERGDRIDAATEGGLEVI